MKKVLVSGCNGKMGQILCRLIGTDSELKLSPCGVDTNSTVSIGDRRAWPEQYSVVNLIERIPSYFMLEQVDVIIDFSSPSALPGLINTALSYEKPLVIATTGLSDAMFTMIEAASEEVPIFYSANMSTEIYVLQRILEVAVPMLKGSDIEISEEHHNRKADSPSGTAKMLANTINKILNNEKEIVYGRQGKRQPNEIGISAIRGGNVCGVHTVHFFGENDTLEIKHTAYSRDVFAEGAIRAAKFLLEEGREPGLYSMHDLF